MNKRYKITQLDENEQPLLTLEQCKAVFTEQHDFTYEDAFIVTQDGVQMKIKGDFFMWHVNDVKIPFRFFDGEVYVAVAHDVVYEKAKFMASLLQADCIEG